MKPYYEEPGIDIYHGDCRDILPSLPKVDLVLTDPPYGIGFKYESYEDNPALYEDLMKWLVIEINRLLLEGGSAFVWQAIKNVRLWPNYFPEDFRIFAAIKNFCQFRPTPIQFSWDPVIFWHKGKPSGEPIAGMRDYHIGNTAKYIAEPSLGHPCPRPLDTVSYIISIFPNAQTILDPFMGSGTTLRAAKDLGRKAIGIEIEEKYCEIAARRMQQEVLAL